MRSSGQFDATFHVELEADWVDWASSEGEKRIHAVRAVGATTDRPAFQKPGTVLVRLTVRLPASAFYPLRPAAAVVVPLSMTEPAEPVEAFAEDPHDDVDRVGTWDGA